ncbi:DUF3103 family protein [Bowmanella denitrificans]|uniref:DUF3103 family protein n=1 Tax=Bowmanella denitrificans TaxID=366582 RepID=UPI000C9C5973|nr:DUF3103 family protein [Bowmanella denitrificans]
MQLWQKFTVLMLCAFCCQQMAHAASTSHQISQQKRELAYRLATQYTDWQTALEQGMQNSQLSVSLAMLAKRYPDKALSAQLYRSERAIKQAKGLKSATNNLLEIRLANRQSLPNWQAGQSPLFAFAPAGNEASWDYIEAFDTQGKLHLLDVYQVPERPVLVIDTNGRTEMQAAIHSMRATWQTSKQTMSAKEKSVQSVAKANLALQVTLIDKISLQDDKEPWISGDAEIYAIVSGVNASRDEPELDIVDLPYLNQQQQVYQPHQILIYWQRYRWGAADVLFMEQDDNTNYKQLARQLFELAGEVMAAIPSAELQPYRAIPALSNKLLSAMPDRWFINDDDQVDQLYTVQQGQHYTDRIGAAGNLTISLSPLTIQPTTPAGQQ